MNLNGKPLMKPTSRRFFTTSLWAVSAAVAVAGCAGLGPEPSKEAAVKARAEARWGALMARDFDKVYGYLAPSVRAVNSSQRYLSNFGGMARWKAAEVIRVECDDPNRCVATVRVDAVPILTRKFGNTISTHISETWLNENGQWWIFVKL